MPLSHSMYHVEGVIDNVSVCVQSPAKINLFLHVHQPRGDGFHYLKTYFQLIDLYDELTFSVTADTAIVVENPAIDIEDEQDLCYRAAKLLQSYAIHPQGINIRVQKNIPDGGGLGGGSSNAATVLVVLNRLWNINLSEDELLALGLTLGSDVPIFIHGVSTYAEGRGEIFDASIGSGLQINQSLIIVKPNVHASTAKIFQSPLLTKRLDTGKIRDLDTVQALTDLGNDFESVVFVLYPEIARAAQRLSSFSATHLTGTGACIYTVLDDVEKADTIIRTLGRDYQVFAVKALEKSPINKFK